MCLYGSILGWLDYIGQYFLIDMVAIEPRTLINIADKQQTTSKPPEAKKSLSVVLELATHIYSCFCVTLHASYEQSGWSPEFLIQYHAGHNTTIVMGIFVSDWGTRNSSYIHSWPNMQMKKTTVFWAMKVFLQSETMPWPVKAPTNQTCDTYTNTSTADS